MPTTPAERIDFAEWVNQQIPVGWKFSQGGARSRGRNYKFRLDKPHSFVVKHRGGTGPRERVLNVVPIDAPTGSLITVYRRYTPFGDQQVATIALMGNGGRAISQASVYAGGRVVLRAL